MTAPDTPAAVSDGDGESSPSLVDQLADDVAPPDYPPGCPVLLPVLHVRPRSRRAELKRRYAELAELQGEMPALRATVTAATDNATQLRAWADVDDLYQAMDDILTLAAHDPAIYRAWSDGLTDDAELVTVFSTYMRRSQLGEASSSTS